MFWQDQEEEKKQFTVPDNIVDLSFKVQCKQLPLDHANALSQCIQQALPWFAAEPQVGIHLIHGAESGNGWIRPQEPDALLSLSKRTRFMLRLPKHRVNDASKLAGQKLNVAGNDLELSAPSEKALSVLTTIFARYVVIPNASDDLEDEEVFLNQAADMLRKEGIQVKKMMSGLTHVLHMPDKDLLTRSLMIDGLKIEESIYLQQNGLGEGRLVGCGLFMPHKGIEAVGEAQKQ
ncbi:MAG: type I-MYXAN CRISPR-associated protein Cas6/Cmx6 [Gammaproteobacteria bacterium]